MKATLPLIPFVLQHRNGESRTVIFRNYFVRILCLFAAAFVYSVSVFAQTTTFHYSGAIVNYTVPAGVTKITIVAKGAQGGNVSSYAGGPGASMQGDFTVTPGQVLNILVGQQGGNNNNNAGGGGGTFVTTSTNSPLLVAGGGGGATCGGIGLPGLITANGTNGGGINKQTADGGGGSNGGGGGGSAGYYGGAAGGAGLLGNGGNGSTTSGFFCIATGGAGGNGINGGNGSGGAFCTGYNATTQNSFTNGGQSNAYGGFGGGGGVAGYSLYYSCKSSGGGGGYSGGGGGVAGKPGGGGGSYNNGTAQVNASGVQSGNGVVTITPFPPATALKFDPSLPAGDNSRLNYVAIDNPFRTYQKEITVEFWMYVPDAKMPFGSVMGQATSNVDNNWVWLMHPNDNGTMTFYVNDGGAARTANCNIIAGSWHHYAGVASATATRFYIDGALVSTGAGISGNVWFNSTSVIHIGKDVRYATRNITNNDPQNRYARMTIDEVRIWSRALCQEEINNNMNAEINPAGQTGLQEYYRFNQGLADADNTSVTVLNDLSGNNRNGTLLNFTLNGTNSNWVTSGSVNNGIVSAFVVPTAPITGAISVCTGAGTTLSNAVAGGTWTSSNTAVATINAATGAVNALAVGSTTITYTTGCGGVSTATLTVNPVPVVTIAAVGGTNTCPGNFVTLNATAPAGSTYQWNQNGTLLPGAVNASFNAISSGNYTAVVTNNGCTSAASNAVAIIVADVQPPVMNCPANINVIATSAAGAVVNYVTPVGTDNCSGANTALTAGLPSGSTFPIGTTTVTHTVTDGSGLTASCSFTVTVAGLAPAIVCPANITVSNDPGQCNAKVNFTATETTGVPASTITYSIAPGSVFPVGTTAVTATATNPLGTSTCNFYVTVTALDSDGDGVPDACDDDADNDGIPNAAECNKSNFLWSNPPTVSGYTATGTINGIGYTYTSSSPVTTTTSMYAHNLFPVSYGVPNANPTIQNTAITNNTITFASPMTNPVLVFASIGQAGLSVPITFGAPVQIVWSQNVVQNSSTKITGTEGYAIVRMMGTFSSVSFNYLVAENWCNFAFGADFMTCGDTDSDGIPDYLDTDSDGDGCPDAIEGSMSFSMSQTSNGRLIGGVNSRGIPLLAGSGQGLGTSQNYVANCFCQAGLDETKPVVITKNITVNLDASGNAAITAAQVNNGSTDNCSIAGVTVSKTSFDCSNLGANTITLSVTDKDGNVGTAPATVTVQDVTPPVISCQSDISSLATSAAGAIVNYTIPVGTDNCSGVTTVLTSGLGSGLTFPIGTTKVTYQATDVAGNTTSCSFNVTITGLPPVIVSPGNQTITAEPGKCGAVVNYAATETTGIPASAITYSINPGSIFPVGTTAVTATATNAVGSSACTFNVTVTDNENPVIAFFTAPVTGTKTVSIPYLQTQVSSWSPVTFNFADPLPAGAVVTGIDLSYSGKDQGWGGTGDYNHLYVSGTNIGGNQYLHFTQSYNLTYTGSIPAYVYGGNNAFQMYFTGYPGWQGFFYGGTMTIHYTIPAQSLPQAPAITVNTDPGVCGAVVTLVPPVATDNCGVATTTNDAPAVFPVGTTTVTWTVTDIHGNSSRATQTVTVADNEKPTITTPAAVSVSNDAGKCSAVVTLDTPTTGDNCGVASTTNDAPAIFPVGTTTVTWSVTDMHGNSNTAAQTVTVTDNEKPVIACAANQVFCANFGGVTTYRIPALSVSDNCGIASTTYAVSGATNRSGSGNDASGVFAVGVSTVTFTVTDVHNNVSTCSFTVAINPLPVATITPSTADAFCNKLTLTGSSTLSGPFSYQWLYANSTFSTSNPVDLGLTNDDGVYSLFTTDANGCRSEFAAIYNYQKQNLSSSYTIIAYKEAELGDYNTVASGSIGVLSAKGEAEIGRYSTVTSPGSFVKAARIKLEKYASVSKPILAVATPVLPTMIYNTANTRSLPNYEVKGGTTVTLNGNYGNLNIKKGSVVTLTGTVFGTIHTEEGAQLTFAKSSVSIDKLQLDKGPKAGYTYVHFAPNSQVLVSRSVSIGDRIFLNPEHNKVTFYVGTQQDSKKDYDARDNEARFHVNGKDAKVTVNVMMPNGKLKVNGGDMGDDNSQKSATSYVYMTGLFVAAEVEGEGKHVIWNSFDCSTPPSASVNASAFVSQSVSTKEETTVSTEEELKITVMPNPSTTYFTLKLESRYETPVTMRVMEAGGRVIDSRSRIGSNSTIQIGHSYSSGIFYAEMIQGIKRKVVQLIKSNK